MRYLRPDEMLHIADWIEQNSCGCYLRDIFMIVNPNKFYITDLKAHGIEDKWQDPAETLSRGTGDCEDLSFLVGSILMALGWRDIRILMGYYTNICHVWVEVRGPGGHWWLLETTKGWDIPMQNSEGRPQQYQPIECLYCAPGIEPIGVYPGAMVPHGCEAYPGISPTMVLGMIDMFSRLIV